NIASCGMAGLVAKKVNHTPRFMPPQIAYYSSVATTFLGSQGQMMKVTLDEQVIFDGRCLNVFVCNGSFSGAGMNWAPMAKVDDGIFEVIIGEPLPKYQLILSSHRLY